MRKFDYSFLKRISVPADIMNYATSIYEMKAKAELRRSDFAEVFSAMESVAKIQSVKSSNAIEGIITTDKRIRDIVNKSTAPQGHNELEIAGYRDALDLIHGSYSDIPFSEKSILELHRMLLQPSGDDLAGKYKTEGALHAGSCERNCRGDGAAYSCVPCRVFGVGNQPAAAYPVRDSGLPLHLPVPQRKRQNVKITVAAFAV